MRQQANLMCEINVDLLSFMFAPEDVDRQEYFEGTCNLWEALLLKSDRLQQPSFDASIIRKAVDELRRFNTTEDARVSQIMNELMKTLGPRGYIVKL